MDPLSFKFPARKPDGSGPQELPGSPVRPTSRRLRRHRQSPNDFTVFRGDRTHSFSIPRAPSSSHSKTPPVTPGMEVRGPTGELLYEFPASGPLESPEPKDYEFLTEMDYQNPREEPDAQSNTYPTVQATHSGSRDGPPRLFALSAGGRAANLTYERDPHARATDPPVEPRSLPYSNTMTFSQFSSFPEPERNGTVDDFDEKDRLHNSQSDQEPSRSEAVDPRPRALARRETQMSEDRKTIFHEHFSVNNDEEELTKRYSQILHDCRSRSSHRRSRAGCPAILLLALSIFSTFFSGVWLTAAIMQPTWGRFISASGPLPPDTASTLTALFAKLIEISFVSVFVAHMGQVLTRRAFGDQVRGVTLSELTTLRNWVMQPGTLITGYDAVPIVIRKFLAWICLAAALAASLYTTASDAMVSPKLMFGQWQHRVLTGHAMSSYANNTFVRESCVTPITMDTQEIAGDACLGVVYPGHSYHNFFEFMSAWHSSATNGTTKRVSKGNRPLGTATLYNDTTLIMAWAEQETSNVTRNFEQHGRIIDNITLAIPHPGVYGAALDSINDILQPVDSSGVGEYRIQASTLSPAVGVMCVNMELDEIAPLIDTQGSGAIANQVGDGGDNLTVVDDIFYWGDAYGRLRPVFPVLPLDFNIITDATVPGDAIYILGKKNTASFYTLCELRSWLSPRCSSQFEVSGTTGNILRANCGDTSDTNRYEAVFPNTPVVPSNDWHDVAREWQSSVDLNAGITNSNSSSHRILTELILDRPSMPDSLPSMAEGLAVLASSTLVFSSLNAQLRHDWDETSLVPPPGLAQRFNASIMMQEYTSSHTQTWQLAIFYPVLGLLFLLNAVCLVIHANKLRRGTLLTDFTDPANTFALAINSPPSEAMKGCCGGGPDRTDLAVPWRVAYSQAADHYYFEEAQAGGKVLRHGSYRGIAHRGDVVGGQDDVASQPSGDHAARAAPYG